MVWMNYLKKVQTKFILTQINTKLAKKNAKKMYKKSNKELLDTPINDEEFERPDNDDVCAPKSHLVTLIKTRRVGSNLPTRVVC